MILDIFNDSFLVAPKKDLLIHFRRLLGHAPDRHQAATIPESFFFGFRAAGWCFQRRWSQKYCSGWRRIMRSRAAV